MLYKVNRPDEENNIMDMRTAFYVGMGRPKTSTPTDALCYLWVTARHSIENHPGITKGVKGELQIKSDRSIEFTCLYDNEIIDLAILGCENISNIDMNIHHFGSLLYPGEEVKLAGFGMALEQAKHFIPSVKSVTVALTNCSIYDSDKDAEPFPWRNL